MRQDVTAPIIQAARKCRHPRTLNNIIAIRAIITPDAAETPDSNINISNKYPACVALLRMAPSLMLCCEAVL